MEKHSVQVLANGLALGRAKWVIRKTYQITRQTIPEDEVQNEIEKFEKTIEKVIQEIDLLIQEEDSPQENIDILSTHKLILKDPELARSVEKMIKYELLSLEKALENHFRQIISYFENMDNDYFSHRSSDFEDVVHRLLGTILEAHQTAEDDISNDTIIIAESVRPSEVTKWYAKKIRGICAEKGSKNCHAAIIARSMSVPYVTGISNIYEKIKEHEELIIDDENKLVIVNPDKATQDFYQRKIIQQEKVNENLNEIAMLPTQTKDGKKITLFCNMEIPDELMAVNRLTSDGIGLFRTEFLFMERENLPEEEEQYQIYKKIADAIQPQPFIIRTIDVGGDKLADSVHKKKEQNPGLGMRGIRISLADLELFKKQIRAIIRANEHDNIKIMFPMISCVQELKQAKLVVQECLKELNKDEKQHPMPIGTMIEIPAAALNADILARECDFFSIGTNDLIQYTLAVDRDNETVATYYKPNNVAILRLIKNTINHAQKHNIPVSVCGEMASQPEFVPLLIGLGINELSVSPGKLLVIKKLLLELNYADEKKKIDNILKNIYEDEVTL